MFPFRHRGACLLVCVVACLLQSACHSGATADELFQENVQPLFEEYCTKGCHVPMGYSEFMLLGKGYGPEHIVNVPSTEADLDVIEPGNLSKSYMWHKLNGTHLDVGGSGDPMPIQGFPLPDEELDKIEEWILALE